MTYRVDIRQEAEAEIDAAFLYIYRDSPQNARRWLRGLYKAVDSLEMFPQRCGLARESQHLGVELRQYSYKSHRIIFKVDGDVVHVRHAAQLPFSDDPGEDDSPPPANDPTAR